MFFRQYISQETRSPEVPVKRSDLTQMVETAESARLKLYKNLEVIFLFILLTLIVDKFRICQRKK
jgi:hypothetical protein